MSARLVVKSVAIGVGAGVLIACVGVTLTDHAPGRSRPSTPRVHAGGGQMGPVELLPYYMPQPALSRVPQPSRP